MKSKRTYRFLAFMVLGLAGCQRPEHAIPQRSMWSGSLELAEGKLLPFRMNLDLAGSPPNGYFLIGDEKTPIPEILKGEGSLILRFSEYGAEMRAAWDGSRLSGNYFRIRSDGTKSFKFEAVPEASPSSGPAAESLADAPVGNYQVLFQGEDKIDGSTVAKLWNDGSVLYGTFIAPDGDYGLLFGKQVGRGLQLNRFTGWQATVITLEKTAGTWAGEFYAASNDRPRPFILKPRTDLNPELPQTFQTVLKNPASEFTFSGASLSGETVTSADDRFKGKALIVDIMGTWCHNCLDEAPVLEQLQQQFGKDGLEIVGLSFEISGDPDLAKKNLQLYKDRFGLTYTLLFCGSLDDANVKKQIHSQLDNFFAYPTAIFMDASRKVQAIHSGFKGPGTGEEFRPQVQQFVELAKKITGAK